MTGSVRKAAVLAACVVLFGAAAALAGVPSPGNSDVPLHINLVGHQTGTLLADSTSFHAKIVITVRDLANNPIPNSSVAIVLTDILSDTRLGANDDLVPASDGQRYQGINSNCGGHAATALTNAAGEAWFVVEGGGKSPAGAIHPTNVADVVADGVNLGNIKVSFFDLNGANGVELLDLSLWGADYFLVGIEPERADYDGSGIVDLLDLSQWGAAYFGMSDISASAYCTP